MKPIKIVTPTPAHPDAPTQTLGLAALASELAAEGASVRDLFARTGAYAGQLEDVFLVSFEHREPPDTFQIARTGFLSCRRQLSPVRERRGIGLNSGVPSMLILVPPPPKPASMKRRTNSSS